MTASIEDKWVSNLVEWGLSVGLIDRNDVEKEDYEFVEMI
jgi:hypothetical protein